VAKLINLAPIWVKLKLLLKRYSLLLKDQLKLLL
jgi:hypothetical protein